MLEFKGKKIMVWRNVCTSDGNLWPSLLVLLPLPSPFSLHSILLSLLLSLLLLLFLFLLQLDCGIHPGLSGMDALPYTDMIDAEDIDLLLITQ